MFYFNTINNLKLYVKHEHAKYLSNKWVGIYQMYYIPDKSPDKSHKSFMRIDKFINNGLFGTTLWGDVKPIAGVDVVINTSEQLSCVEYYMINDVRFARSHTNIYGEPLTIEESELIKNIVFEYVDNISKTHNMKKIQLDIHSNLKDYSNIKQYGYELTDIESNDNPFWIKTFKVL
jgi:hypothetical protein